MLNYYSLSWLIVFILILMSLGFALYIAYTKMDEMLTYLSNCRAIQIRKTYLGRDPFSRMLMLGAISAVLMAPHLFLRDGGADQTDIDNFPKSLKKVVVLQRRFINISGTSMIAAWAIGEYMGWLK
ncbi:hypothetical protein N5D52_06370 [Pseudomonas sp. GD03860]|uniref:hypothetical protein n=1 Tax=Pseudomonas TaxID=286 RepID=UPI0023636A54|nr:MULTISPECIES: hypothetical protein [Pseudomonas]MDD2060023.1 hypothetical protein [Pseudomonas putida]MDH0636557.1 hypothetical protein [Pseudomonas sp. GD03860]